MADERLAKAPELRGRAAVVAVAIVVLALVGGSAWGWRYAGPIGGLLGVLLGAAIGALGFTIVRATSSARRFGEAPAPDVRELPPDQAIQVLSALMSAGASVSEGRGAPALAGGLLGEIAKARARAEAGELDGALAKLRALAEDHPRSPAVSAEIARLLADHDEHRAERLRAAARAIALAIHGGMNRLAASLCAELDEAELGELELDAQAWERLAKVVAAAGDEERAADCRRRANVECASGC